MGYTLTKDGGIDALIKKTEGGIVLTKGGNDEPLFIREGSEVDLALYRKLEARLNPDLFASLKLVPDLSPKE